MIPTKECSGNSPTWTWTEPVAIEPGLLALEAIISSGAIPDTMPDYGRTLLLIETQIDCLVDHRRLSPRQADLAHRYLANMVAAGVPGDDHRTFTAAELADWRPQ